MLFLLVLLFSLPFMSAFLIISGIPRFSTDFFLILFIAAIFDTAAAIFYYKALSLTEVSLLAPISSFNPVFILIFASLFLGENPTFIKSIGIITVVAGAYLLNLQSFRFGILKPFSLLFSNKGIQLYLLTNLIWAVTPVFQKRAIFETSPATPIAVPLVEAIIIIFFLSPLIFRVKSTKMYLKSNLRLLIFFAGISALGQLFAMNAFSLTNVAYAAAIFKLSTLITVILGAIIFHEKHTKERFVGAAVMVLGTILIAV